MTFENQLKTTFPPLSQALLHYSSFEILVDEAFLLRSQMVDSSGSLSK